MLENIINQFFTNKEENIWLEYKSFWYWTESEINKSKGWGEFLKDFAALFNAQTEDSNIKYLIIGFDESSRKTQDYDIDKNNIPISIFSDNQKFKEKIIQKLKVSFINRPKYKQKNTLEDINSFFEINTITINEKKILVITIEMAPYILEINKILQGNESFREGCIPIRRIKTDGSPENINANMDYVAPILKKISEREGNTYPIRDISIEKIVDIFRSKNIPNARISQPIKISKNSSGVRYEVFKITGEYIPSINFIYFSSHTVHTKSIEHLKTNLHLNSDQVILLTDEFNKNKGKVDKTRLNSLLNPLCKKIEVYYLEEFAKDKLYRDLFSPEIFHQGGFNINDFIEPYTDSSNEKTADILLAEWYRRDNAPLLVLKGVGGIGKTTVVKYFLDSLYVDSRDNTNILFISSHEIINEIMKNSKVDNLFDFYHILAEKNNVTNKFNKNLLELSVDHGDLIIVLDGIDEVIAKMGVKFDVNKLVESIFDGYSGNLAKAKVIITCRDYFWNDEVTSYDIEKIALQPFNKDLANQYFTECFSETAKVKKAMALADNFALGEDKSVYIPYVLDMIKDNLLSDKNSHKPVISELLHKNNISDYLIFKVCEREIVKLSNISIDNQVEIFINLAYKFNGVIHQEQLSKLENLSNSKLSIGTFEKFKGHPLLVFDKVALTLTFRYDFFNEYFKVIALARYLNEQEINNINEDIISIILQYISFDGSFIDNIKDRLSASTKEKFTEFAWEFINAKIKEIKNTNDYDKKRLSSAIFILLISITKNQDKISLTNLLKLVFSDDDKNIENLNLINLHTKNSNKPIFDFRGLNFINCWFENYECFSECTFDDKTYFKSSTFKPSLIRHRIRANFKSSNFDSETCQIAGVIELIEELGVNSDDEIQNSRLYLKSVLKAFWSNSSFRQMRADDISKKFKNNSRFIEQLINLNVISKTMVTTNHKRKDSIYYINKKYSNLRKVMEENETCYEFDEIITLLHN